MMIILKLVVGLILLFLGVFVFIKISDKFYNENDDWDFF